MKRLLTTIILGIGLSGIAGAQNYFNNKATLHSFAASLSGVISASNKYYTTSACVDSINDLGNGLLLSVIGVRLTIWNADGSILRDTVYQRRGTQFYSENNALLQLPNKDILVPLSALDTPTGPSKLALLCFDSSGNYKWIREYPKPYCTNFLQRDADYWSLNDFRSDGQGNWLMLSSYQCGVKWQWGYTQTMLTKLDSNFNVVWYKSFGDNNNDSRAQSLIVENGGYTFGGYYSSLNQNTKAAFYRTELFKTDTAGNLTWHWLSDSSRLTFGATGLIKTKDGGYVFSGQGAGQKIVYPSTAVVLWWPWIEKIYAAGSSQWHLVVNNHHTTDADYCSINKLIELPNGDIVAAGQIVSGYDEKDTLNGSFGTLLRLTANGNVKWRRQYSYNGDTMIYHLYDMKQSSDGGYIMAGQTYDVYHKIPTTLPWQRAWLMKVDSNGCTSNNDPQCLAVGVPQEPKLAAGSYKVYPNPVTDQLLVSYQKADDASESFIVTDITGRAVVRSLLSGNVGIAKMDLRSLQSGIYFYRIMAGETVKQSGKISKQ